MDFNNLDPALVLLTVVSLSLAPFVAVMVTSFTKIVVVLSLLRNALGLQQVPPNVVINGLAIVLSIYVMYPVILDTQAAIEARKNGQVAPVSALSASPGGTTQPQVPGTAPTTPETAPTGTPAPSASPAAADGLAAEAAAVAARGAQFANVDDGRAAGAGAAAAAPAPATLPPLPAKGVERMLALAEAGKEPLRGFLIKHSHDAERGFFLKSAQRLLPPARRAELTVNDFIVIVPAFTVSELTAAFQIGFLIFLPFLVIDLVVSNILLALGMMMLSPTTISLPFKLLLFVLIDGWAKLVHGLVLTYGERPMTEMLELTKQALWLTLLLSAPPVGAAALVGLLVAFVQAATQLQEQTFAYALKFLAIVIALFVTAALIGGTLYTFADRLFVDFPRLVRG